MAENLKTILFVSPYAVVPPRYGGSLRVYNLCLQLSRQYRVMQFAQQPQRSAVNGSIKPVIRQVTPLYTEYSSRNPINILLYGLTSWKWNCPPVWQSTVLRLGAPRWLRDQMHQADIIHVEQPWQFAWIYYQVKGAKPVVLGAQNVEAALYTPEQINAPGLIARRIVSAIQDQEAFAVRHATHVMPVTVQDMESLVQRHGIAPERCTVVPNGIDCALFIPATEEQKALRKAQLGLDAKQVILFAGSMIRSSVEAAKQIVEWAMHWPDERVCFLIVGTVGRQFAHIRHPRILFTGSVSETKPYFEAADLAINPMLNGSGSNLKQLEFMAMGLPTVATPIGTRGIPIVDGVHGLIRPLEQFPGELRRLLQERALRAHIGHNGRTLVEQYFDWFIIVERMLAAYGRILASQ